MSKVAVTDVDTIVVGQGLAGTTLAWRLENAGHSIAVVDPNEPQTSSKIAAGLITPISGKRLTIPWRYSDFFPAARAFYSKIEKKTGGAFFHSAPALRIFQSEAEQTVLKQRLQEQQSFKEQASDSFSVNATTTDDVNSAALADNIGGFSILHAARLDVAQFLNVSRAHFAERHKVFQAEVDWSQVRCDAAGVRIPNFKLSARAIIFCQGYSGRVHPLFGHVPFDASRGDIVTVRIPQLRARRVLHKGIWLVPIGNDLYRAGSTYHRTRLDCRPEQEGRLEIEQRLKNLLRVPFEMLTHHAAVRPILKGRRPAIGFHPEMRNVGYFNGLASRGALQAPLLAEQLAAEIDYRQKNADALNRQSEIDCDFELNAQFPLV